MPFDLFDVAVFALFVIALILGVRSGALPQLLGLAGAGVGVLLIVALAAPAGDLVRELDPPLRALIALGGAFLVIAVGEAIGSAIGSVMRRRIQGGLAATVDGVVGGFLGLAQAVVLVWLIGGLAAAAPYPALASQAQRSVAVRILNAFLPPPQSLTADLGRVIGSSGLPQLFVGLEPLPAAPVETPSSAKALDIARDAFASTVRIEGTACHLTLTGTGFAIARGYVVTNAHVIAGASQIVVTVEVEGGEGYAARVVLFDPQLDVAVLRVSGLRAPALVFAAANPKRGAQGAALGHPGGRPLSVIPAAVASTYRATGRDLYGTGTVTRDILELRADIEQGDSGGPLILEDGTVGGVVFAESKVDPAVGYALSPTVVAATVMPAVGHTATVDTGPCTR